VPAQAFSGRRKLRHPLAPITRSPKMPGDGTRKNAEQHRTTEQRLASLEGSIAALAHEIQTGRLLIAGAPGDPQIVCEVSDGTAELRVEVPEGARPQPALVLFTSVPAAGSDRDHAGLGPATGLQLWADGDAVVELGAWCDDAGSWRGQLHVEGDGS
jgi:hypothetical protein